MTHLNRLVLSMAAAALLVGLVGACTTIGDPAAPSLAATPVPTGLDVIEATPPPETRAIPTAPPPTPTPMLAQTAQPSSSGSEPPPAVTGGYLVGDVLVVVAGGLRVRSQPRVADDSEKLTPLLSSPDKMVVLDGPVKASGYAWYRVLPFDPNSPVGWVAAASRDGAPWVAPDRGGCDATAPSVTTIAQTTPGAAIGCYGDRPMTFEAKIVNCAADVDAIPMSPAWFSITTLTIDGELVCPVLVEPDAKSVDLGAVPFLHLDPNGETPDPLPLGVRVRVTGQFDHPAAQQCTSEWLGDPVLMCRTQFVVTRIVAAS